METDSPVVYHGTSESRFPINELQKIIPELTAQEKEVFKICRKESLYYRCLPLAVAGIAVTQLAVKKGFLTPHPVWGSGLQMAGAAFVGWLVGKISYRTKCEDKFLQLENSSIGDSVRRRRGYVMDRHESGFVRSAPLEEYRAPNMDSSFNYYPDTDYRSSSGSQNVDDVRMFQYSGLDDRERPSTDRDVMQETEEAEPVRRSTTYEDLRRRNREEHERLQRQPSSRVNQPTQPNSQRRWGNLDSNSPPRRYYKDPTEGDSKNAYGDSWDNPKF